MLGFVATDGLKRRLPIFPTRIQSSHCSGFSDQSADRQHFPASFGAIMREWNPAQVWERNGLRNLLPAIRSVQK